MRTLLLSLLLAGATGCTTRAYLVADAPPPAQRETVADRPGYVWVHGHYARQGGRWKWVDGHHVRERSGYSYVDGRWEQRKQGWVWIEGGWRSDRVVHRR